MLRTLIVGAFGFGLCGCCPGRPAPVEPASTSAPVAIATATASPVQTVTPIATAPPMRRPALPKIIPPPSSAEPVNPGGRDDSNACSTHADCKSNVCEGEGCGPDQGRCMPVQRICTRDLMAYCGCDGKTFRNSGSCPGKRFKTRGPCPGDSAF